MNSIDELATIAITGDQTANDELYTAIETELKGAARLVANRFRRIDYDDFEQECYLLYRKALSYYNPSIGSFLHYLKTVILNHGATYCLADRVVKIPRSYIMYYAGEMNGTPRSRNSKEIMNKSNAKYVTNVEMSYCDNIIKDLMDTENEAIVRDALNRLPERYQKVLSMLYGIDQDRKNVCEASKVMQVSEQRISQLRKQGLVLMYKVISNDYHKQDLID